MDIRPVTDRYAVSPQIAVEDIPAIVAAGFTHVICNRPDAEVPPSHQAEAIGAAVKAAGLEFIELPATRETMTLDMAAEQAGVGPDGKVLAYCASGTRSTMIWALGQAGTQDAQTIVDQAAQAGYDLSGMTPVLTSIAQG